MLQLGILSFSRGLAQLSVADLFEWWYHYQDEPFGWDMDNFRSGMIAATVANYSGACKKAVAPSDFYPVAGRQAEPKPQSPEQMAEIMRRRFGAVKR